MYPGITVDENYFREAFDDYRGPEAIKELENAARSLTTYIWLSRIKKPKSICILGCGFGDSVKVLREEGFNAWGMDISQYAIKNSVIPYYTICGDACDPFHLECLQREALGKDSKPFDLVVTENMLPLLTDTEARDTDLIWGLHSTVIHRLCMTPEPDSGTLQIRKNIPYNWHTPSEWRKILGPTPVILDYTTWQDH